MPRPSSDSPSKNVVPLRKLRVCAVDKCTNARISGSVGFLNETKIGLNLFETRAMPQDNLVYSRLLNNELIPCLAILTDNELLWKQGISLTTGKVNRLDFRDIVFVRPLDELSTFEWSEGGRKMIDEKEQNLEDGFAIAFVCRMGRYKWKMKEEIFRCHSPDEAHCWVTLLNDRIEALCPHRPHRLLVFINPSSGHKKARHVYDNIAAPLFHWASVETHIILTTHRGHATEYLLDNSVDQYDGVICVGGDGFLAEAVQGLLLREREKANLPLYDGHNPGSTEIPCPVRVGAVPAGSTDTVMFSANGTNDVLTAVLHIIIGDDLPVDVAAIHSGMDGSFIRYAISMLAYGFHADLLKNDDHLRWLGPRRYDFSGFSTFLSHPLYSGEVTFLPSANLYSHVRDGVICCSSCRVCAQETPPSNNCAAASASSFSLDSSTGSSSHSRLSTSPTRDSVGLVRTEKNAVCTDGLHLYLNDRMAGVSATKNGYSERIITIKRGNPGRRYPKLCVSECRRRHVLVNSNVSGDSRPLTQPLQSSRVIDLPANNPPSWTVLGSPNGWQTVAGTFLAVNAFIESCRCAKSLHGPSPCAHLGDGCLDLILVRKCRRSQFLKFLMRTAAGTELRADKRSADSPFDLPFVSVVRVCAFRFRPMLQTSQLELACGGNEVHVKEARRSSSFCSPHRPTSCLSSNESCSDSQNSVSSKSSIWCADGEIIPESSVSVYVHRKLIHLFSRGPEPLAFDRLEQNDTDHSIQAAQLFNSVMATSKPISILYQSRTIN
ncbi:unnamed protein product [Calicophoron daubneyi]|uniref:DAGKc domain-containing protein n=1 Tax=Calicophoron daubneyi TaxID=300641 RepID=A0AAV2TEB9_CALDB